MPAPDLAATIDRAKRLMIEGRDVPWLLAAQAEARPDKPFVVWEPFTGETRTWTYREFRDEVRQFAGSLAGRGVALGDKVMIHLGNCPEFLVSWFACLELGAVPVTTNVRAVARDIEYFADHAGAVAAITSPQYAELISTNASKIRFLAVTDNDTGEPAAVASGVDHVPFADLAAEGGPVPERATDPWGDFGIQYTSGTTSRPKAVLWTHANAIFGAQVNSAHMQLSPDDITQIVLPLYHTNAQSYSLLSTLWMGGTVVVQPRFSASRFWPVALRNKCTWVSFVPFCVRALAGLEVPEDHSFRFFGPAVRLDQAEAHFGVRTLGWWGMTETITHGIVGSLDHPGPNMSIGRASPAYEIDIRTADGDQVGLGETGQLFIRGVPGVSLFKEYYRNEEATRGSFDEDGWFDTGDLVRVGEHGDLFFADRAKDMLKVGAENVAASEIEAVIMSAGWTTEVAVVGQPHEMLDEVPVAFVIASGEAGDDLGDRIIAHCAEALADFKVPRAVHVVDSLPRSELEKVAKNVLRERLKPAQG